MPLARFGGISQAHFQKKTDQRREEAMEARVGSSVESLELRASTLLHSTSFIHGLLRHQPAEEAAKSQRFLALPILQNSSLSSSTPCTKSAPIDADSLNGSAKNSYLALLGLFFRRNDWYRTRQNVM